MLLKKILLTTTLVGYTLSTVGCGVLLYPERQGQKGGRIDPTVAILDGVGLLLFLIPGLIALAVDFHQGTIYLPNTSANIDAGESPYRLVKIDGPLTEETIEAAIDQHLGLSIDLSASNVQTENLSDSALGLTTELALAQRATFLL